jgi:hypothetical protein
VRYVPKTDETGYLAAKTKREYLRLDLERLDLALRKGEMAPIAAINAHVAGSIVRCREMLLRIPAELKDRLAYERDPGTCEELLSTEFERVLSELREFRPAKQE